MKVSPVILIAGAAVAAALVYLKVKGAKGVGADLVSGAVDLADGVASEAIFSVGEVVGVPRTNKSECQRRIEEFRAAPWYEKAYLSFGISAYCPASDYLRFITTNKGPEDK